MLSPSIVPGVTINADSGIGSNVINHAVAQAGVLLSGGVSGLPAGRTFTLLVADGPFNKIYTAIVNEAGTGWTATIPNADAAGLANGTLTVTAQVANQTGTAQVSQTFLVATSLPTVTITGLVGTTNSISTAGATTNQATQTISGKVTETTESLVAGTTVKILDNGQQVGTATVGTDGSWSTQVTLVAGTNSITATDIDTAGNSGTSPPVTFTLATNGGPDHWNGSNGDWSAAPHWSSGVPTSGTDAIIDGFGFYTVNISQSATANTLTINDPGVLVRDNVSLTLFGPLTVTSGTFDLSNGSLTTDQVSIGPFGILLVDHGTHILPEPISNNGLILVSGNGTTAEFGGAVSGSGSFTINSGSSLQFSFGSNVIKGLVLDNGTVEVGNGTLALVGPLSGTGCLQIGSGADLILDGASSLDVIFAGSTGRLVLKDPVGFSGTIAGLTANDEIDLTNIASANAKVSAVNYSSSTKMTTLTVTDGHHTDTVKLVGNYANSSWTLSDDGNGGTLLVDPPAAPPHTVRELTHIQDGLAYDVLPVSQVDPSTSILPDNLHKYIAEFSSPEDGFVFADEAVQPELSSTFKAPIASIPDPHSKLQSLDSFDFKLLIQTGHHSADSFHNTHSILDHELNINSSVTEQFVQIFATSAYDQLFLENAVSGTGTSGLPRSPFDQHNHLILHP